MTLVRIDFLEIQTHSRLGAVRSLLDTFEQALAELKKREHEALKQQSKNEGWEYDYYDGARRALEDTFEYWLPRFAAYSVIILLHAVLENQLRACAVRVWERSGSPFNLPGVIGIDAAASCLKKLNVYDVKQDNKWETLCDLRKLRNIFVHSMESKGRSEKSNKEITHLKMKYPDDLKSSDNFWEDEIWISVQRCWHFIDAVESVLDRVLAAVNTYPLESESSLDLPPESVQPSIRQLGLVPPD